MPVSLRSHVQQGGFQILKWLFSEKADTIPLLTQSRTREVPACGALGSSVPKNADDYKVKLSMRMAQSMREVLAEPVLAAMKRLLPAQCSR